MFAFSEFKHDYTKSVFKHFEPISEDYRVFVNGQEIPVYSCRISKYPMNREWPGFQRPIDQTELASFVNIVSDEQLHIEVIAARPHKRVMIKPYSKKIAHEEIDGKISFVLQEHGQFVLETDSYHHCLYIFNSRPIVCPDKAAVTYYFGPGVHMPGKITLKDNESVYVDKDALVFGCIYAENAKNIRVLGNGLFDDTGEGRIDGNCYENFTNGNVKFYDCENIKVEGVLFRNSAIWCINLFHCFHVDIDDIKVFGQWRYNTDGVDIVNSQDITVKNSFLHSFDDTVTIKGIDRYAETNNENILTENCVLWCDWGKACEIGIETACRVYKNITFRNCDILRGGDSVLDIQNGDCAEISDILFENINVEYNAFDTPQLHQKSDNDVYNLQDGISIPHLIKIANHRFRSKENLENWGVPMGTVPDIDLNGIQCGGVHDVTYKNINVFYDKDIPLVDGKYNVPISMKSVLDGVQYYNIRILGITINGVEIGRGNAVILAEDVKELSFTADSQYAQMKKNTVKATNQVKNTEHVVFENADGLGPRVLFVGNSITFHGEKPDIGWDHCCGMAASCLEKDYVHRLISKIKDTHPDAAFCICQAAPWERSYTDGRPTYHLFEAAREFHADIIVMRLIENCPYDNFDHVHFKPSYGAFLDYLNPSGKAKIILTTGFWKHPGDRSICEFAEEHHLPLVYLGDLGEDDRMKAVGLFWHEGVANHPGDLGMQMIAERIYAVLKDMLS